MGPHGVPRNPHGYDVSFLVPAVVQPCQLCSRRASIISSLVAESKPGSASLTMSLKAVMSARAVSHMDPDEDIVIGYSDGYSAGTLHSMEGPMLPRWIDDPTVDSAAMYSAFLSVVGDSVKEDCGQLFLINHRPGPSILPSFPRNIWCRHLGCSRCGEGRGGYQFRWYHPSWVKAYLSMKRLGSWAP